MIGSPEPFVEGLQGDQFDLKRKKKTKNKKDKKQKKNKENNNANKNHCAEAMGRHSKAAPEPSKRPQVWQNEALH